MKRDPKNQNLFIKNCVCSYMFKYQSPSKYSPFDAGHLSRCFLHFSKQVLHTSILMPFTAYAIFCFTSSTSTKCFPLRTFFIGETAKKVARSEGSDQVNRDNGAWGWCHFGSKNFWTFSAVWAGGLVNHPSWNGQTHWKDLQTKIHWSQIQPLTTAPAGTLIQMGS